MAPIDGRGPALTEAQLRALLDASTFCARTASPAARRRALLRALRSLLEAELVAVWLGCDAAPGKAASPWPLPGATRGLVGRAGARTSPRGVPLVARATATASASSGGRPVRGQAAVVAVWRPPERDGAPRAQALLRALAGWVAGTIAFDPPQPARGPTLVDADLRDEPPAFLLYLATLVAAPRPRPARPAAPGLTGREEEVAREVAAGRTNAEIAARLGMSEHTVKQHLKGAFRKLGVARRAGLAALLEERANGGDGTD